MKKILILTLFLLLAFTVLGNQEYCADEWIVSYHAYFNEGWEFQKIEFLNDGNVILKTNGQKKYAGHWIIEEIIPKGSPLVFRLLKFEIFENEFIVLYNDVKNKHYGRALISDNQSKWAMHPIEFEMKRIEKINKGENGN